MKPLTVHLKKCLKTSHARRGFHHPKDHLGISTYPTKEEKQSKKKKMEKIECHGLIETGTIQKGKKPIPRLVANQVRRSSVLSNTHHLHISLPDPRKYMPDCATGNPTSREKTTVPRGYDTYNVRYKEPGLKAHILSIWPRFPKVSHFPKRNTLLWNY